MAADDYSSVAGPTWNY